MGWDGMGWVFWMRLGSRESLKEDLSSLALGGGIDTRRALRAWC